MAMKEAATAVQTASRSLLAKRKVGEMKQEITEQNDAARAMQSSWRQRQARGELVTRKEDRETKVRGQAIGWGTGVWVMWVMWGSGGGVHVFCWSTRICLLLSISPTHETHTHTRTTLPAPRRHMRIVPDGCGSVDADVVARAQGSG